MMIESKGAVLPAGQTAATLGNRPGKWDARQRPDYGSLHVTGESKISSGMNIERRLPESHLIIRNAGNKRVLACGDPSMRRENHKRMCILRAHASLARLIFLC